MESFDVFDLINTAIAAFAILGGMVYAIIKTKVDVEHLVYDEILICLFFVFFYRQSSELCRITK